MISRKITNTGDDNIKIIGILLIIVGIIGLLLGGMMVGDIGIAAWIGAIGSLISGIGFIKIEQK